MKDGPGFRVSPPPTAEKEEKEQQCERIIEAVEDTGVVFWHDRDGFAYATIPVGATTQRYRVQSRIFRLVVRRLYGAAKPAVSRSGRSRPGSVSDHAMAEVIPAFEAPPFSRLEDIS